MKVLCVCLSSTIQRTLMFPLLTKGSVNRTNVFQEDASGKAVNAARVINQLEEVSAKIVCPLGSDNYQRFLSLAIKDKLEISYVLVPGTTRECWTLLDLDGTTTEVIADEKAPEIKDSSIALETELLNTITKEIQGCDALLLAGSRSAMWHFGLMGKICYIAKAKNKIILADYHGEDLKDTLKVCIPDIIKVNQEEFCTTFDIPVTDDEGLKKQICAVSAELKNIIIVTRGGSETFASDNGSFALYPCEKVKPVNTTACGDSFAAGFITAYIQKNTLEDCLKKATWCAARNAETMTPGAIK